MPCLHALSPDNEVVEIDWVDWADDPLHRTLFIIDEPQPRDGDSNGRQIIARVYGAKFKAGTPGGHQTLFHQHCYDTVYLCVSAAGGSEAEVEVWNELIYELEDRSTTEGERPTHVLLPAKKVYHNTGTIFCNMHQSQPGASYIHRISYHDVNKHSLEYVGIEMHPVTTTSRSGSCPWPNHTNTGVLTLEREHPHLFRAWRMNFPPSEKPDSSASLVFKDGLGGGFARRGGMAVLAKPLQLGPNAIEVIDGHDSLFGTQTLSKAVSADGWKASHDSQLFPAGATWPLGPLEGSSEFSLHWHGGDPLEMLLVEFL